MKLGTVAKVQGGYAFKSQEFQNEGVPIIRIGNLDGKNVEIDNDVCYPISFWDKHPEFRVEKNSILIAMSGATVGKIGLYELDEKALLNQRVCILKPNENVVTNDYLYFFCQSPTFKNAVKENAFGCAQPNISAAQICDFEINVPSIKEQEKWVRQLRKIKNIIDKRELEIVELDNLIKSRFVELFGDININDKKWDCQPLGELCTIVRGGSPRPIEKFLGGDVPWIKIGDATDGDNIYLNSTKEHIIQEGVKKSRLVKSGSLIFANCGVSLGFARIITFDGCIHDGWLAMEDIDERLDKVFLLQSLNQMTQHFREIAPAGTQPNLNTAIMKAYNQIIPPMDMQQEFIGFVEQVDKLKFELQNSLNETKKLMDSLMQQYFG